MSKIHDLSLNRFGRLLVVWRTKKRTKSGGVIWLCLCSCGNLIEVRSNNLLSGNTQSCGCLHKEKSSRNAEKINFIHGDSRTRLYKIWQIMKDRCSNPNAPDYKYYGGRGITVCKDWINNYLIFKIWAMANGYADNLTIDRINYKGNYEPNNCQWITLSENTKKAWKDRRAI